jgi:hypothetical protein
MNENKKTLWFYASFLPLIVATIGIIISTIAHLQGWGEDKNGGLIIRVFFCEITFVVSVFGLVTYMRQPDKTSLVKNIRWMNAGLVISTLLLSVFLFLG